MTTTTRPGRLSLSERFYNAVHLHWNETVAANRALLRVAPYDDYLMHRDERKI